MCQPTLGAADISIYMNVSVTRLISLDIGFLKDLVPPLPRPSDSDKVNAQELVNPSFNA